MRRDEYVARLIPKPVLGLDVRRLPIGPVEGFVLSRVDGRATDTEIALVTGMSPAEIIVVLHRLVEVGAIAYEGSGDAPRQAPAPAGGPATTTSSGLHRRVETATVTVRDPTVAAVEWPELAEDIEIDLDRKRMILETFYSLEKKDHYRILNIGAEADKKAVKSAYFQVVANFHPDRYFGKKLGTYKQKLEAIFRRLTEAHDTLTRKESRAEYDRYLESQRATQELDAIVDDEAHSRQLVEVEAEIEREAKLSTAPPPAQTAPRPALTPEERRRALARKFSSPGVPQAGRPGSTATMVTNRETQEAARQVLQARLAEVRAERVRQLIAQADQALATKNLLFAANALRLAVSLSPDDKELGERFATVERDAAASLADRYLEQARYDEQREHWAEAAQAYERVLKGSPSAQIYERAAHCMVEARLDMKKAVDLARKAVEMAPKSIVHKITLARAFARAGMTQSALGELERARTQDPSNDSVKEWINRVKRGEV
jgi:curved DNA-binding protein CbpA